MKRVAILGRGAHTLPSYRALVNCLAQRYDVTVYAEVPCEPEWRKLDHTYTFKCVPRFLISKRVTYFMFFLFVLRDHLKRRYHILHAHSTYPTGFVALLLKKLLGVPVMLSLDGGEAIAIPAMNFGDLISERRKRLNRWAINNATVVTVLTRFQLEGVVRNLSVKREILIIPRGVNFKIDTGHNRELKSPVVFLHVAYLSPVKDPVTLLKTFSIIRQRMDAVLIQVGQDYMNGEVQKMAADMGLSDHISFEGHVGHEQIYMYYQKADVLLMTSLFESQAVVVAEALAAGVLVCGTHVGLMADLSGHCCITAPVGEAEFLASSILSLVADKKRSDAMRRNGLEWSKGNTMETTAQKIMTLYEQHGR